VSINHSDIKRSEIKIVNGDKWKFDFRENGYVIVSAIKREVVKKKEVVSWQRYLHAPDLESCLQYVYTTYNGGCDILKYEELESA